MQIHTLQLATEPFNAIVNGQKTIESRLYDDKRRNIRLGDTVIFTNRVDTSKEVSVRVTGLLHYSTFHELFSHNNPAKFGGSSVEDLESQINKFYTHEDQQNGVLGIEFILD